MRVLIGDALYTARLTPMSEATPVLVALGQRTRERRQARGLTQRELAERSGVSLRFLMDVEAGRGNISVRRLADLATALATTPADLVSSDTAAPRLVALLGLRGAGKTTVGRRLSRRLRVPFVELDRRIEQRAGLALGELFSLHGEAYYRQVELEVLREIVESPRSIVMAVGGGLVTAANTYDLLRAHATTVWLRARPEDYWTRVVRQGDRRPIDTHPQARAALRGLISRRNALYARADVTIDTAGQTPAQVVDRVLRSLPTRPTS